MKMNMSSETRSTRVHREYWCWYFCPRWTIKILSSRHNGCWLYCPDCQRRIRTTKKNLQRLTYWLKLLFCPTMGDMLSYFNVYLMTLPQCGVTHHITHLSTDLPCPWAARWWTAESRRDGSKCPHAYKVPLVLLIPLNRRMSCRSGAD